MMIHSLRIPVCILILVQILTVTFSHAAEPQAIDVSPTVSAEVIKPGEEFLVGFHFTIKEPWHIYWKYPGPSGLPTRVKFSLPDGLTAGELQFPTPRRFVQPGNIVGYGYLEEAFMWVPIKSSKDISIGTSLPLKGEVRWLGCSDRCVPGKSNFDLTISFGEKSKPVNQEQFTPWLERLPQAAPPELTAALTRRAGALAAGSPAVPFSYTIEWPVAPLDVQWFPNPEKSLLLEQVETKTSGTATTITFSAELQAGEALKERALDSVLSVKDANGKVRGYQLKLPLS